MAEIKIENGDGIIIFGGEAVGKDSKIFVEGGKNHRLVNIKAVSEVKEGRSDKVKNGVIVGIILGTMKYIRINIKDILVYFK